MVEDVWSYCSTADFRKNKPGLVHLDERGATKASQDAITILDDSGMELVVG